MTTNTFHLTMKPAVLEMLTKAMTWRKTHPHKDYNKVDKEGPNAQLFLFSRIVRATFKSQSRLFSELEGSGKLEIAKGVEIEYESLKDLDLGTDKTDGNVELKISEHNTGKLAEIVSMIGAVVKISAEVDPKWTTLRDWLEIAADNAIKNEYSDMMAEEAEDEEKEYKKDEQH